jgi:hypothetical protein
VNKCIIASLYCLKPSTACCHIIQSIQISANDNITDRRLAIFSSVSVELSFYVTA